MPNETARKVWIAYFGNNATANDCFGNLIRYNNYGIEGNGGWELDHIWPKHQDNEDGANVYRNIQPLFWKANREKSNDIKGRISNINFFVHKVSTHENKIIGRMAIHKNGRDVWAYPEPRY